MKPNWVMISVLILTVVFWYSIFTFGLFQTVIWTMVITAIVGIILNVKGII